MSIINEQAVFLQDVRRLLDYCRENDFVITGGELYRTPEQQELYIKAGKSKTRDSMHLKRCAIDLNFFSMNDGICEIVTNRNDLEQIGNYWESLDVKNKWGGNFRTLYDTGHFERKI